MKIILVCLYIVYFSINLNAIDFEAMKNIKQKSGQTKIVVSNFDTQKAKEITLKMESQTSGVVSFVGKKVKESFVSTGITSSSGAHAYQCSYYCRTDGIFDNHTNTFRMSIKANTRYEAEDKLGDIAKNHCRSMKASGKWMWSTSRKCE